MAIKVKLTHYPGRDLFNRNLIALVDAADIPRPVKVAWNDQIERLVAG